MNTNNYPKTIWVLVQSTIVLEGNKEVIDPRFDRPIGGTSDPNVAEKLGAVFKENESLETNIRSDFDPLPKKILDSIDTQTPKSEDRVDQLLNMVDLGDET